MCVADSVMVLVCGLLAIACLSVVCLLSGGCCLGIECLLLFVVFASLLFDASCALRVVGCCSFFVFFFFFLIVVCCALRCLLRWF